MVSNSEHEDAVAVLLDLQRRTRGGVELQQVFDAVVAAVTESLGFGAAVLSVREDLGFRVVAASGPSEVGATLLGTVRSEEEWEAVLAETRPRGLLRMVYQEERTVLEQLADVWVPVLEPLDHPDAWRPLDALFAMLRDGRGQLLGVLSVDLPDDGLRPSPARCDLIELFAVHTAAALEHARLTRRLTSREAAFRSVVRDTPVGMALFDENARFCEVNTAFCDFVGLRQAQLLGRRVAPLIHPADATLNAVLSARVRSGERVDRVELRHVRSDGATVWGRVSLARLTEPDGSHRVLAHVEDVTERRAAEEALRFRAEHDELTGLPRRAVLLRGLAAALEGEGSVAVLFADVDHFKLVNDSLGHAAGDQLLVHVARQLVATAGEGHLVGRLSGDEFVLVLRGLSGAYDAIGVADRLRSAVEAPVVVQGRTLTPSVSIGIAVGTSGTDPSTLLANADAALYRAKERGRGRWAVYDDQLRAEAVAQLTLRSELSGALARGEFRLHYQPIVALASGAVLGYEALLRWLHPQRGMLAPTDFLAALEDSDAEDGVAQWVLDRACADAAGWAPIDGVLPFVSLNVPATQLSRPDLGRLITAALRRHRLDPDRLWIEVTEDRLVADDRQVRDLQRLRAEGVHVGIDDFGTGYAGLAYLQRLPADIVKIDKVFVQRITDDLVTATIVRSVVELSRLLGLTVVGEGIETQAQAAALAELGVHLGQGFLFGRPRALPLSLDSVPHPRPTVEAQPLDAPGLAALRTALGAVDDGEGVGRVFVEAAGRLTGAHAGSLVLAADGVATTVFALGYPATLVERFRTFGLTDDLPLATAITTARPVYAEHVETQEPLHPALPRSTRTVATLAALPLVVGGVVLGAVGVSWDAPVCLTDSAREALEALAVAAAERLGACSPRESAYSMRR